MLATSLRGFLPSRPELATGGLEQNSVQAIFNILRQLGKCKCKKRVGFRAFGATAFLAGIWISICCGIFLRVYREVACMNYITII
ncbi:hypothetical protein A3A91_02060 [Candidatus Nomurabacteria bacterium RIFCSPLOWO2_01_FULL_36_16]|uniref:Uncharacterized protein n=1 Tax=Candidatus Nomurabacteria bacterium RIFCSPLOWO2_01_FULL_36_16 TaxID=1801767 RepID=A0A1F6WXZ5_9BACT|nr:MAG: hypothetical protein A3A91_02060 [Candidatus Nomurabacteria bacterium RIFCSPLOWO2_01_FULL_36_16]